MFEKRFRPGVGGERHMSRASGLSGQHHRGASQAKARTCFSISSRFATISGP